MCNDVPRDANFDRLTRQVLDWLDEKSMTIACAESITGGLLTSALINPAGASTVVAGGVSAYATRAKIDVLGLDPQLIADHGTVHPQIARAMALRIRDIFKTNWGIATTGVAGPGSHEGHRAGTVVIGIAHDDVPDNCVTVSLQLTGSRGDVRRKTVIAGVENLWEQIQRLGC